MTDWKGSGYCTAWREYIGTHCRVTVKMMPRAPFIVLVQRSQSPYLENKEQHGKDRGVPSLNR